MKNSSENLLFKDGECYYFGSILSEEKQQVYFQEQLQNIPWQHDEIRLFGKVITTARKTAWYGDENFEYTYSKMTKTAQIFTPNLLELKELVEAETSMKFNSCLLNLYHSGAEGMSWHADNEAELGLNPAIASISLGAERKFLLKHKESQQKVSLQLAPGSLLLMKGSTQKHWLHSLPKTTKVSSPRINLTFRNIKK